MGELSKLPNIGKVVEAQLVQAGIRTEEDLKAAGARQAWLEIQKIEEIIFNCNSGGISHQHCMDILIAERMSGNELSNEN